MKFFFSIIIPTYNREKKLKKAIDSVINQTYKNWELVIVDNCSNDGTAELVESYNSKKIFFYTIKNKGVISKSRNYGIERSRGEYLAFLDSDDWWINNKLELVSNYANKGHKLIYHDHYIYSPYNLLKFRGYRARSIQLPAYDDLIFNGPAFATSSVIVKKSFLEKIKNFNTSRNLIGWEDWDAWLRLSKKTDNFFHIKKKLSYITLDNENLSSEQIKIKNLNAFKIKYLKNDILIPNWYAYTLLVCYFKSKIFFKSYTILSKIKFNKLNFKQKINFIFIYLRVKFKLSLS